MVQRARNHPRTARPPQPPRPPRFTTLGAILAALLAGSGIITTGCRSAEFISEPGGRGIIVEGFAPDEPLLIDSPSAIPSGWAIAEPDDPPLAGDGVTLLIIIQRGSHRAVYYLDIELLNEPGDQYTLVARAEGMPTVRIEPWEFLATRNRLLDEHGRLITESRGSVAWSLLRNGPYDSLEGYVLAHERRDADPEAVDRARAERRNTLLSNEEMINSMRGILSFVAFGYGVRDDGVMRRLIHPLFTIRQGILLLAANFSADVRIDESSIERAGTTALANGLEVDGNLGAVEMLFGSTPVLRVEGLCIRPVAPLGLVGGLVRLDAHNIGQPSTRVIVQPIASRRGDTWPTLTRLFMHRESVNRFRFCRQYLNENGEWIEGAILPSDYERFGISEADGPFLEFDAEEAPHPQTPDSASQPARQAPSSAVSSPP